MRKCVAGSTAWCRIVVALAGGGAISNWGRPEREYRGWQNHGILWWTGSRSQSLLRSDEAAVARVCANL